MNFRVLRPVATVAALALALSAGLAPTAASAQQQVFGRWSTQNHQNQRQVVGTVTYFSQYDLRISNGNGQYGYGQYGNGDDNGNGRQHRRHRHHENNGQYPNGQQYPQYPNGGQQYPNGQNGNGRYGDDGRYGNGQSGNNGQYGNGNEQRIHLHQGTVINPRGTTLQNGMQIRVSGHPNADGSFEADRVDVLNGQGQGYYRQ